MRDRGRITITDALWYVVALAVLSGMYPVAASLMERNADVIPGNTMVLLQSIMPLAVLILLASMYMKASVGNLGGGGR